MTHFNTMQTLFVAHSYFDTPDNHSVFCAVATFLNRADCAAFCKVENDAIQCDYMRIEEIALVDDYGYPIRPRDFPSIRPAVFADMARPAFDWSACNDTMAAAECAATLAELKAEAISLLACQI